MHCPDGGKGTDYTSNGDVVMDTFDDHLREPRLVPCTKNEVSNKLILGCGPLGVSARLSQSGCVCVVCACVCVCVRCVCVCVCACVCVYRQDL